MKKYLYLHPRFEGEIAQMVPKNSKSVICMFYEHPRSRHVGIGIRAHDSLEW
jgi:hypothetical protein